MSAAADAFQRAIERLVAGDGDGYAAVFAPDAVVEWPFAPPDGSLPEKLQGRAAIAQHMAATFARAAAAGRHRSGPYHVRVHEAAPDRAVVEFCLDVHEGGGAHHRLPYVHIVEVDAGGQIAALRDYYGASTLRIAQTSVEPLVWHLYAALDTQDWTRIGALLHADFDAGPWRARLERQYRDIPDGHHLIDDVIVDGDRAVSRCRFVGTRHGEQVEIAAVHIDRFCGGLLSEHVGIRAG